MWRGMAWDGMGCHDVACHSDNMYNIMRKFLRLLERMMKMKGERKEGK